MVYEFPYEVTHNFPHGMVAGAGKWLTLPWKAASGPIINPKEEMKRQYDYLIVGSGLMGATFAHLATQAGKRCLVVERRQHTGGNIHCEQMAGINVHQRVAVCQPPGTLQPLHQQSCGQLAGTALQPSLQYEHVRPDVGCDHSR